MFLGYLCHLINSGSSPPPQVHWVVKANIHRIMGGAGEMKMNSPCPPGARGWRANQPASNSTKVGKENKKQVLGAGETVGNTTGYSLLWPRDSCLHMNSWPGSASQDLPTMLIMSLIDNNQLYWHSTLIDYRTQMLGMEFSRRNWWTLPRHCHPALLPPLVLQLQRLLVLTLVSSTAHSQRVKWWFCVNPLIFYAGRERKLTLSFVAGPSWTF